MLHEFLSLNHSALIARCREKVALRPGRPPADPTMEHGIPMFIDQLIATLRADGTGPTPSPTAFGALFAIPASPGSADIGRTAAMHGNDLLRTGVAIDQVVHDYGDLCQAVTEMAAEQGAAITVDEFRTLNRCLDEAIANAITEFGRQRDQLTAAESARVLNERLASFAHELRNLIGNAILAVATIKQGSVGLAGATGGLLDRSLFGLRDLVDRTLTDLRPSADAPERWDRIDVADFIAQVQVAAALEARARELAFVVAPVEDGLAVDGDRQILAGAVTNLLQNAVKFTRPRGRIGLAAYAAGHRIRIEVDDECGGIPAGKEEAIFRPFEQLATDRTPIGLGLGLPISRRGIEAHGGSLSVRNTVGKGCTFIVDLPGAVRGTTTP